MLVLVVVVVVSVLQVTSAQSQGLSVNISGADEYQVITHLSSTSPTSPTSPDLTHLILLILLILLIHLTHFTSSRHCTLYSHLYTIHLSITLTFHTTFYVYYHHTHCITPCMEGRREERGEERGITTSLSYLCTIQVYWNSQLLFSSAPPFVRVDGQVATSLTLVGTSSTSGSDILGDYQLVSFSYLLSFPRSSPSLPSLLLLLPFFFR